MRGRIKADDREMTLAEVSRATGLTINQVRDTERSALAKLRRRIGTPRLESLWQIWQDKRASEFNPLSAGCPARLVCYSDFRVSELEPTDDE